MGQYTRVTKIDEKLFALLEQRDREKFPAAGDYLNYLLSSGQAASSENELSQNGRSDRKEEMSTVQEADVRKPEALGQTANSPAEPEQREQMCMLLEKTVTLQETILEKLKIILYELKWY